MAPLLSAFECFHDPSSPARACARELSAMMRASRSDNLKCTFASYSRYINSIRKRAGSEDEEGVDVRAMKRESSRTRSRSPRQSTGTAQVLDDEFRCLSTAVQAVLKIALPIASRRRSASPRKSVSPMPKPPQSKRNSERNSRSPKRDARRYSAPIGQPVKEHTF